MLRFKNLSIKVQEKKEDIVFEAKPMEQSFALKKIVVDDVDHDASRPPSVTPQAVKNFNGFFPNDLMLPLKGIQSDHDDGQSKHSISDFMSDFEMQEMDDCAHCEHTVFDQFDHGSCCQETKMKNHHYRKMDKVSVTGFSLGEEVKTET